MEEERDIKIFVYNEFTAIPFSLIKSRNKNLNKKVDMYIFFHDIFDSFTEYIDIIS
jgi:hypothetical protein